MKESLKQKAIQSKSWIKGMVKIDNKPMVIRFYIYGFLIFNHWTYVKMLLTQASKLLILGLNKLLGFIPSIIHFLEALVSTLSYLYKKEFFYGLFKE